MSGGRDGQRARWCTSWTIVGIPRVYVVNDKHPTNFSAASLQDSDDSHHSRCRAFPTTRASLRLLIVCDERVEIECHHADAFHAVVDPDTVLCTSVLLLLVVRTSTIGRTCCVQVWEYVHRQRGEGAGETKRRCVRGPRDAQSTEAGVNDVRRMARARGGTKRRRIRGPRASQRNEAAEGRESRASEDAAVVVQGGEHVGEMANPGRIDNAALAELMGRTDARDRLSEHRRTSMKKRGRGAKLNEGAFEGREICSQVKLRRAISHNRSE
ncbi:hypothetical protein K469DRAFT_683295 [Zopfia rhizophila CBS 207.26]|uniref:Uncharacterized protein n=1 Tax=Zopfia rhizophila CBS 207.26 TaxID=1314779 RepID=A0A6A6EDL7_9PEZI|nr:hypothetical protein K469DRAFT_683295 [Zopfia rhizophila CBS 207.26]